MNIAKHSKNWIFVYLKMRDYRNAWHYFKRWIKFSVRNYKHRLEYIVFNSIIIFALLFAVARV